MEGKTMRVWNRVTTWMVMQRRVERLSLHTTIAIEFSLMEGTASFYYVSHTQPLLTSVFRGIRVYSCKNIIWYGVM